MVCSVEGGVFYISFRSVATDEQSLGLSLSWLESLLMLFIIVQIYCCPEFELNIISLGNRIWSY